MIVPLARVALHRGAPWACLSTSFFSSNSLVQDKAVAGDSTPLLNSVRHAHPEPSLPSSSCSWRPADVQLRRGFQSSGSLLSRFVPEPKACWSCEYRSSKSDVTCSQCSKLQPPKDDIDYYELLGMPEATFDVDLQTLEQRYRWLQWQVHPDRFARHPQPEPGFAAETSMRVNIAYNVLRSPLLRAKYLMSLWCEDAPPDHDDGTITDAEFLMKVMEEREEIESCDDQEELRALLQRNRAEQDAVVAQLSEALSQLHGYIVGSSSSPPTQPISRADACRSASAVRARNVIVELVYLTKLEEEIRNRLAT